MNTNFCRPCFHLHTALDWLDMQLSEQQTPYMGEVRVKVKLSNGADRLLAKSGALDANRIRSCEVDAMVDTGAVRSVFPLSVAKKLGLPEDQFRTVAYADG